MEINLNRGHAVIGTVIKLDTQEAIVLKDSTSRMSRAFEELYNICNRNKEESRDLDVKVIKYTLSNMVEDVETITTIVHAITSGVKESIQVVHEMVKYSQKYTEDMDNTENSKIQYRTVPNTD